MPIWVVVEAESITSAIEVLNSDPEWNDLHYAHVQDDEFIEDDFGTQTVRVHGSGRNDPPYPIRYHDWGYSAEGIDPRRYAAARFN
jgi:hypothetical protein